MSKEEVTIRGNADGIRVLDVEGFLLHNAHSASTAFAPRCKICQQGFSAVAKVVQDYVPKPVVVQGDGVDEEGDSSPSPPGWWDYEEGKPG